MNKEYLLNQLHEKTAKMREAQRNVASLGHKYYVDLAKTFEKEVDQLLGMLATL